MASFLGMVLEALPARYQYDECLSSSESGVTIKVQDAGLRDSAAVMKVQALDGTGHGTFLRYCGALASVRHPGVEAAYTYGILRLADGTSAGYTTRAFVNGVSLANVPLPLGTEELARVGAQVASGLSALHGAGLVHQDLKPDNTVVRRYNRDEIDSLSQCVLIDLSFRPTTSGEALSEVTLQYVAPELLAGEASDATSDLYSLGVMLYFLGTGNLPFPSASLGKVLQHQQEKSYRSLSEVSSVSRELSGLIDRLLDPHPSNRPESADAVLAELVDLQGARGTPTPHFVGFAGREAEMESCMSSLMHLELPGASCVEVNGFPLSGVTAFLRELQDKLEAAGVVVLTARPGVLSAEPLYKQLEPPLRRILRANDALGGAGAGTLQPARTTTELLDDLFVASRTRRLVLFVDDWTECNADELKFLRRVVLQDGAAESDHAGQAGRCQLVLGSTASASVTSGPDIQRTILLSPWSRHDLQAFLRAVSPDHGYSSTTCDRILGAAEGRPGAVVSILEALFEEAPGDATQDEIDRIIDSSRDALRAAARSLSALAPLKQHDCGDTLTALAIWGEWTDHGHVDKLREAFGEAGARLPDNMVEKRTQGSRAVVRIKSARLRQFAALDAHNHAEKVAVLLRVLRPLWRTDSQPWLRRLVWLVVRLPGAAVSLRWQLRRVLLALLKRGLVAETEKLAHDLAESSTDPWIVLLGRAAHVARGGTPEPYEREGGVGSDLLASSWEWVTARAVWRARFVADAHARLCKIVRANSPDALVEDCALVAAEAGDLDNARSLGRRLLLRIQRRSKLRAQRGLGRTSGDARLRRLWARYFRVRQRVHAIEGQNLKSARYARREYLVHRGLGDRLAQASCLNNEGQALIRADQARLAEPLLRRCAALRGVLDDERGLVTTLTNLAIAHTMQGGTSDAASALNRARVIAARNGLNRQVRRCTYELGLTYCQNGQLQSARRTLRRLVSSAHATGDISIEGHALLSLAEIALDSFHPHIADGYCTRFLALARQHPEFFDRTTPNRLRAEIALRLRDDSALSQLLQSLDEDSATVYRALGDLARGKRIRRPQARRERDRARLFRADWLSSGRRVTLASLRRVLRIAKRQSLREALSWAAGFFAQPAVQRQAEIDFAWRVLGEQREGHDDLQILLRAHVATRLFELGRAREAWGLVRDALDMFRRLERKLERSGAPNGILSDLQAALEVALGNKTAGHSSSRSAQLFARAFKVAASFELGRESDGEALARIAEVTARSGPGVSLIDGLLEVAIKSTGAHRAILLSVAGGEKRVLAERVADGVTVPDSALSWAVASAVILSGRPQVYGDALASEQLASHRSIASLHLRSLACIPVRAAGEVCGALYLDHHGMAGLFRDQHLALLEVLAYLVGKDLETREEQETTASAEARLVEAHRHLVRSERNRVAGQIAAGLAHDIKNVLTTIVARCQLARTAEDPTAGLKSIERAAHSAATIVDKLQQCAKEHGLQREELIQVGAVAQEAADLLGPRLSRPHAGIDVTLDADPTAQMMAVPGELRELFLNLIVNACDAMPNGGALNIAVRLVNDSKRLQIKVRDSGCGMPAETRRRAFEPFFTTKGEKGTGLGLAVVRNVVVRYAGEIEIKSEPGQGTEFVLSFPLGRKKKEDAQERASSQVGSA